MGVTEILAYKTSKGKLCKTKEGAELEEKLDNMDAKIELLMDAECWNGMGKSDVSDFLKENRVEIIKILS